MKYILTVILATSIFFQASSQNYEISYKEELLMFENLAISGLPVDQLSKMKKGFEGTQFYFNLSINKKSSNYIFDKKVLLVSEDESLNLTASNFYKKDKTIYRTPSKSDQTTFLELKKYTLADWTIEADKTDEILGLKVVKAVLQADPTISAWFCPLIPLSNGPAEYGGLPGLILKVEGNHKKWEATSIEKIENATSCVEWPTTIKTLTPPEWKKWLNSNKSNFLVK